MHTLFLVLLGLACPVNARRALQVKKHEQANDIAREEGKSPQQNGDAPRNKLNSLTSLLLASNPGLPLRASPAATLARPMRTLAPRMPIGVPKVPYKAPGSQYADWIGLYDKLYRERTLFLGQQVDDEIANQLIAVMLYLESEEKKDISMYINSPGGSVTAGLAVFDTMRYLKSKVRTVNVGLAASMGSLLLAGGEKGMRYALPRARTMIHQPASGGMRGQASDIAVEARQIVTVKNELIHYYSVLTGKSEEQVRRDIDRDNFMGAEEAKEYGLVDQIIQTTPDY